MREAVTQVIAPMLSVNEPEAQLVALFVTTGSKVEVGDPLCTLETTKATFEVEAEVEGYIHDVLVAKGQHVPPSHQLSHPPGHRYSRPPLQTPNHPGLKAL